MSQMSALTRALPVVSHANPVTQAGFTQIPNAVMLRDDLKPLAKLVYGYLGHLAWRNHSDGTDPPQAVIARDLGVSENAVREALRDLARAGLIEAVRRGQGQPNVYVIYDAVMTAEVAEKTTSRTAVFEVQEPLIPEHPARARSLPEIRRKHQDVEQPPVVPQPENRPAKVNGKPVTDHEYGVAATILIEFNRLADTNYRAVGFVEKIIRRIREHPELPIEAHTVIIQRNLAEPWWQGAADPRVIYGNADQFERSVHNVRVQPKERGLTPDEVEQMGRIG